MIEEGQRLTRCISRRDERCSPDCPNYRQAINLKEMAQVLSSAKLPPYREAMRQLYKDAQEDLKAEGKDKYCSHYQPTSE